MRRMLYSTISFGLSLPMSPIGRQTFLSPLLGSGRERDNALLRKETLPQVENASGGRFSFTLSIFVIS